MTLASASAFLVPIANPEISRLVYNNEGRGRRARFDRLRKKCSSSRLGRQALALPQVGNHHRACPGTISSEVLSPRRSCLRSELQVAKQCLFLPNDVKLCSRSTLDVRLL